MSFPAFVGFHFNSNCFGVAKNVDPFSPRGSSEAIGNGQTATSRRHVGCFRVKSCDDVTVTSVIQLYGESPFSHVFLNSTLASLAGFEEGQEVILESVEPTSCTGVEVAPLTEQDFEIMDRCSTLVEDIFLDQITVVEKNMVFPLWLSPGVHVSFRIVRILPETNDPVRLVSSSELHILPVNNLSQPLTTAERKRSSCQLGKVQNIFDGLRASLPLSAGSVEELAGSREFHRTLRCLPMSLVEKHKVISQAAHPSVIYALRKGANYSSFDIVSVQRGSDPVATPVFAVLIQFPDTENLEGLPKAVASLLKYRAGHGICLDTRFVEYTQIRCSTIQQRSIHMLQFCDVFVSKEVYDSLKSSESCDALPKSLKSLSAVYPILMPLRGFFHTICVAEHPITVKLSPSSLDVTKLNSKAEFLCFAAHSGTKFAVQKLPEHDGKEKSKTDDLGIEDTIVPNFGLSKDSPLLQLECQAPLLHDISKWAEHQYSRKNQLFSGHALVLGKEGSGKSILVTRLARRLARSPRCVYSQKIDCSTWKGKQSDNIEKSLKLDLGRLALRQPSLLILDGLDFLQLQNEEEQRQLGVERIFNMLWRLLTATRVPVVATARKLHSLHKSLVSHGGKRLFSHVVEIPVLTQTERLDVLREFLEPDCDLFHAAKSTENFTLVDLRRLATRIQIEARIRGSSTICEADINHALEHSRPSGYVLEKKKEERVWSLDDVGGMEEQKQLLTEVLLWPAKYSELYDRCGVRLGRGVLLHGGSGCGKTLLANAFAAHTQFNIISVKGPELLSKYIGSSEENVRQVFERARASSPCVVVFDELDSLAPRRGSDSTGVTDRVVNQLLTELDGAEGLQGVYVIGCTSRIDMIDPALLRPGRFDHLVECKQPSEKDRSAILRVILKQVPHSKEVSPTALALRTNHWTGADLKALITNAQFLAMRNAPKGLAHDEVQISSLDIDAVFEESRPKEREQQKNTFKAGQRVTLA